jgi:hypothetical protein
MSELLSLDSIISWGLSLLWVTVLLAAAGIALLRFRTTISGLLLAGGFATWALKLLLLAFISPIFARMMDDPLPYYMVQSIVSTIAGLLIMAVVAVGFATIPGSLRKLSS